MVAAKHATRRVQPAALDLDAKEPLQIRIPVRVKRAFKAHAALRGLEPNELFVEVWGQYESTIAGRSDEG
ncbi:MAG TPA: hypothetical protein VL358_09955 [Caulobacteraceae bacterium]|jgi:hypothetical protein|nr:hypothetical protein [Caulobacteraceae bacterium]